ncbi:hypothetical protein Pint_17667 [Pistacia integerrima]|uniref:Uncharacterized protein n=1 Tax=Pistacia integerrima TaxID=434235 RepID=A0ACC0Z0V5_9ROSI|nr:hypothetical protein Pint_17667 [Pistacia integerrima]
MFSLIFKENIENSDNGDVVHDHYHRFLEDIEIMHYLGVNAYRFHIGSQFHGLEFYQYVISVFLQGRFVHFAKICFENFGDRVKSWATINEPNLLSEMGAVSGYAQHVTLQLTVQHHLEIALLATLM